MVVCNEKQSLPFFLLGLLLKMSMELLPFQMLCGQLSVAFKALKPTENVLSFLWKVNLLGNSAHFRNVAYTT